MTVKVSDDEYVDDEGRVLWKTEDEKGVDGDSPPRVVSVAFPAWLQPVNLPFFNHNSIALQDEARVVP